MGEQVKRIKRELKFKGAILEFYQDLSGLNFSSKRIKSELRVEIWYLVN